MLKSVDEVIDALGGPSAMAELTGVGPSAVVNWRTRGIAPDKFLLVKKALKSKSLDVSPSVFAFKTEARA
jgi:DNA-binding transcriptional regulator YdaS (Cro superfamily)